jgi:hypothetical protein
MGSGFKIRNNFSTFTHNQGKNNNIYSTLPKVGKVFGVVDAENTPTPEMYKRAGGNQGAIFYLDYPYSKNITGSVSDDFLGECKMAFPIPQSVSNIPALRELVLLIETMNPSSQESNTGRGIYYTSNIPLFNTVQPNSVLISKNETLGIDYPDVSNIRPIQQFQGDTLYQGKQSSAIRFSTTKLANRDKNEWSEIGNSADPIIILTNGFNYINNNKKSIEKINKDLSSIYLTSTQKIPLQTDKSDNINNLTNPLKTSEYFGHPQVIINSDRVTLNSKRDNVMIYAKTNVEISTKNIINLNADYRTHLNSSQVILGNINNPLSDSPQPILLSYKVIEILMNLQTTLTELGINLAQATATKEGASLPPINVAGASLLDDMITLAESLSPDQLLSNKVYIAPNV